MEYYISSSIKSENTQKHNIKKANFGEQRESLTTQIFNDKHDSNSRGAHTLHYAV